MYNPINPGYNTQNQTRITPNYELTISDNPYASLPYDLQKIPPPPPPPPPKCSHKGLIITLVCLLIGVLTGSIWVATRSTTLQSAQPKVNTTLLAASTTVLPTSTPTPTTSPNYTASDIMNDFYAAGIHHKAVEYNRTIWSWTDDRYYVSVHATGSVDFADDSGCTGYCSPQDIGVWVYDSQGTAMQAYNDVLSNENTVGDIPMMGTPNEVLHGRCLLLGADTQSIYGQVVMNSCV